MSTTRASSEGARQAATFIKSQVAPHPGFRPGRAGFQAGFLPPRSSAQRFVKPRPTIAQTAPAPKASSSNDVKKDASQLSELAQWKKQTSEKRRQYMSNHIQRIEDAIPIKMKKDKEASIKGKREREILLHAPQREADSLSLPTIEQTIADEYPLVDHNKDAREMKRVENRAAFEQKTHETRLHDLISIHHNCSRYVTTLDGLETLLDQSIGAANWVDHTPKHKLADLTINPGYGSYTFGKVNQYETEIDDHIMGTAAGGRPGVVEVSHILKNEQSS